MRQPTSGAQLLNNVPKLRNHMKRTSTLLFALLLFASTAFAHDAALHKGPMIEGAIKSVRANEMQLKTEEGIVLVHLSVNTKFEFANDGQEAPRHALREGERVMVYGHKLENGALGATEVMIHRDLSVPHPPDNDHGK